MNGTEYKLFLRQGEAADYVFHPTDVATGTMTVARVLAAKFSLYNLTNPNLSDAEDADPLGVPTAINGGKFVDYPTQNGAFWQ